MAKILVIDDDVDVGLTIGNVLSLSGHEVIVKTSLKSAVMALHAIEVDLVISDLFMPEGDGIEAIMSIKKIGRDIPVILISGGSSFFPSGSAKLDAMVNSAALLGSAVTLAKPFERKTLLQAIDRCLPPITDC